jgi:hypothetical protein
MFICLLYNFRKVLMSSCFFEKFTKNQFLELTLSKSQSYTLQKYI